MVLPAPKSIAVGNGFIRSAYTDFAGTETNVVGASIARPIQ